jgi:hypothetical protein
MNTIYSIATFTVGFLFGYLVKSVFESKTKFKPKENLDKKEESVKSSRRKETCDKEKNSDSEWIDVDDENSESENVRQKLYFLLALSHLLIHKMFKIIFSKLFKNLKDFDRVNDDLKMVLVVRNDLKMGKGKVAAQVVLVL